MFNAEVPIFQARITNVIARFWWGGDEWENKNSLEEMV
jgi:hypothetical protein